MSDLAVVPQPPHESEPPASLSADLAVVSDPKLSVTNPDAFSPAEAANSPRWWLRVCWYSGSIILTCVLLAAGLRLDCADLKAPFYYDLDSLLIMPMVKSTVERGPGGHWRNDRLGAPGRLELHDFPVIDHLHFLLIWMLSKVVLNFGLLYNLYYLLTFPLTTFTAMLAFRQLRLSLPAAAVGGMLYAFLPYHYERWENHYFLAAYWLVPLTLLPVLAICRGDLPFFRLQATTGQYTWRLLSWSTAGLVVLGAATASAGAYYAFFSCAYVGFAGFYAAMHFRKWQPAQSAGIFIAIIVVFGIANHLPSILYQAEFGRNPVTDRSPEEADTYGLKIAHLLLPIEDHNLQFLARIKRMYDSAYRPSENENKSASLGIVGAAGFIGLLISLLLPYPCSWPYRPLAFLTLFGVLLATIGGLGALFNLFVTAQIRAYNRISVFIAFFCLFTTLWMIDRFLVERRRPIRVLDLSYALLWPIWLLLLIARASSTSWNARVAHLRDRLRPRTVAATYWVWTGLFLIGFLDQTPYSWFRPGIIKTLDDQARRYRADARFFSEIERALPPGSRVFCLPYIPFPEYPPVGKMAAYEEARGYIHTDTLVWSFGAMKGREADAWIQEITSKKTEEFLQRIVYRGFDGLLIDKRGFPTVTETNQAFTLIQEIDTLYERLLVTNKRNAHLPEIVHEDGQQFFLDLRPYRQALRALSPSVFDAKAREEQEWPAVIWLGGFYAPGFIGDEGFIRFGPPNGSACIINTSDRTRTFIMSMTLSPAGSGSFRMRLNGLIEDDFTLEKKSTDWDNRKDGVEKQYRFEVPPGRHSIQIRCTPPSDFIPSDSRKLCYTIKDFKLKELR